jgi:hypothetical protein
MPKQERGHDDDHRVPYCPFSIDAQW